MIARGEFRSDLYSRLNVFPVVLPPLRNRKNDILELVSYFVKILFSTHGQADSSSTTGNNGSVCFLFLARERTGTTEPGRTCRDPFLRWSAS
jgi:sigma54-dependent transcription regulator